METNGRASAADAATFTTPGEASFRATVTGEYSFEAQGASGGNFQQTLGALGAGVSGDLFLTAGEQLTLFVGGRGGDAFVPGFGYAGGGGGGSFIFLGTGTSAANLLAAAGGGGGAGISSGGGSGLAGQNGGNSRGAGGYVGVGGVGGGGGGGGNYARYSGGGAGVKSAGSDGAQAGYGASGYSGHTFPTPTGGNGQDAGGSGGFGGGALYRSCGYGGEGPIVGYGGGGGGSFVSTLVSNGATAAGQNSGDGFIGIAPLTPAVPEPSTWAMTLGGFAGLGWLGRMRRRKTGPA